MLLHLRFLENLHRIIVIGVFHLHQEYISEGSTSQQLMCRKILQSDCLQLFLDRRLFFHEFLKVKLEFQNLIVGCVAGHPSMCSGKIIRRFQLGDPSTDIGIPFDCTFLYRLLARAGCFSWYGDHLRLIFTESIGRE